MCPQPQRSVHCRGQDLPQSWGPQKAHFPGAKGGQHVDLDNIHGQGHPNQVGRLESKTPSPVPTSPIILFPS